MRFKTAGTSTVAGIAVAASVALSFAAADRPARADVDRIIASWPATPQKVARETIAKHGAPHEASPSMLVWQGTGPWKRTILYRDEVPHEFPMKHTDLLEQFVDYRVPVERISDVAAYDGSVVVERTKGEVSARCDMEEMNYLALNLMHDVATARRSVEEARRFYGETAAAFMAGKPNPYVEGLLFTPQAGAADLDTPLLGAVMRGMAEGMTDKG